MLSTSVIVVLGYPDCCFFQERDTLDLSGTPAYIVLNKIPDRIRLT